MMVRAKIGDVLVESEILKNSWFGFGKFLYVKQINTKRDNIISVYRMYQTVFSILEQIK